MFKKLARDPRFLDRVHRLMHDRFLKSDMTLLQIRELDRIRSAYAPLALRPEGFLARTRAMERRLRQRGDTVRINEGPFVDFIGSINEVDEAKGKVRVMVSFFGRETPVELDFLQVEKT